jgi:hypothetical protein
VIRALVARYDYQFKFVIDQPDDCIAVEEYLRSFPQVERSRVWLMPQGITRDELAQKEPWLADYCDRQGFNFCPRRQIEWFGYVRAT